MQSAPLEVRNAFILGHNSAMSAFLPWIAIGAAATALIALIIAFAMWRSVGSAKARMAELEKMLAKAMDRQRRFEDTILPARQEFAGDERGCSFVIFGLKRNPDSQNIVPKIILGSSWPCEII